MFIRFLRLLRPRLQQILKFIEVNLELSCLIYPKSSHILIYFIVSLVYILMSHQIFIKINYHS